MNRSLAQLLNLLLISRLLRLLQLLLRLLATGFPSLQLGISARQWAHLALLHLWGLALEHEHGLQTIFHHLDRFGQHALNVAAYQFNALIPTWLPLHLGL